MKISGEIFAADLLNLEANSYLGLKIILLPETFPSWWC